MWPLSLILEESTTAFGGCGSNRTTVGSNVRDLQSREEHTPSVLKHTLKIAPYFLFLQKKTLQLEGSDKTLRYLHATHSEPLYLAIWLIPIATATHRAIMPVLSIKFLDGELRKHCAFLICVNLFT